MGNMRFKYTRDGSRTFDQTSEGEGEKTDTDAGTHGNENQ